MHLPNIGDRVSIEHPWKHLCDIDKCETYDGFVVDVDKKLGEFVVQGRSSVMRFSISLFKEGEIFIHPEVER